MRKKITESTALYPLGNPGQSKLFRVASGEYVGRRAALIQTSPTDITLSWSDSPGATWSNPVTVADDAADGAFDVVMTANGDLQVVYSEQSTNYLVTRRLTLSGGTWSIGAKVTIYSGAQCYDPSLAVAPDGTLWVSYSCFVSPTRTIYVKSSSDNGLSWGSGAADSGEALSGAAAFAWSRVIIDNSRVHVVYHDQETTLWMRSRELSGGTWNGAANIATGSGFNQHFDVGVAADGRLGAAFSRDQLYYREYDGANWGGIAVLVTHPVMCPQVLFEDNVPAVVYLDHVGGEIKVARYTDRRTGNFAAGEDLDARSAPFDVVLVYNAASAGYEDMTVTAASQTAADVFHSSSGCLLKAAGDTLYLGQDARFRAVRLVLSTCGVGGDLLVSYWDGSQWRAFNPANGLPDMSASPTDVNLWVDYETVPADWQKRIVNNHSAFWVRVEVTSGFTIGPVADQISAASETDRVIFRR
jgi:hypothetical protein